jgi:DNA polymerase (family 10)
MDNVQLARMLNETADLMEIAGEDSFRIRSYRNAAAAIEGWPERVMEILQNTERKVTDIPGIGKGIGGVIAEIALRGSFEPAGRAASEVSSHCARDVEDSGVGTEVNRPDH